MKLYAKGTIPGMDLRGILGRLVGKLNLEDGVASR